MKKGQTAINGPIYFSLTILLRKMNLQLLKINCLLLSGGCDLGRLDSHLCLEKVLLWTSNWKKIRERSRPPPRPPWKLFCRWCSTTPTRGSTVIHKSPRVVTLCLRHLDSHLKAQVASFINRGQRAQVPGGLIT